MKRDSLEWVWKLRSGTPLSSPLAKKGNRGVRRHIETQSALVRLILLGAAATVWSWPGCAMPVRSAGSRAATSARTDAHKKPAHPPPGAVDASSPMSPVNRLTVNGDSVEAAELWGNLRDELSSKAETLSSGQYQDYIERQAAQLITDKIAEMLLHQRASLRVTEEMSTRIDKHVDREIRRIVTTGYGGMQRRYEKYLDSKGLTLDGVRERLRREIIITSYLEEHIKPKVAEPTRAELIALYEANADALRRPARRRMSLIDVRILDRLPKGVNEPTREQWDQARREALSRAETAQTELRSGLPFADVARRHSSGLHTDDGGAWGWVSRGSVRKRFEPAVSALYDLQAGDVSDIIETNDSFFLVRCDEIDPGLEPSFKAVQPELKKRHFRAAHNQLISKLITELRSEARIEPADLTRFHAAVVDAAWQMQNGE